MRKFYKLVSENKRPMRTSTRGNNRIVRETTNSRRTNSKPVTESYNENYNGWKNYETWCINTYFGDDEYITEEIIADIYEEEKDKQQVIYEFTERFKDYVTEYIDDNVPSNINSGLIGDLLGSAIQKIDFYELAKTYVDEYYNNL